MNQQSSSTSPSGQSREGPLDAPPRGAGSGVAGEGRGLTSEARHVASELADQATRSAERQLAGGKERAAQAIRQFAAALRHTSETLSSDTDMPVIHDYLGRTAARVEGLSDYLQTKSLSDVVGDVEGFARKEPLLFMGSAFVLGLLGGRFLKSSQPGRSSAPGAIAPRGAGAGR